MDITQVLILAGSGAVAALIARLVVAGATRKRQVVSLVLFVALFASFYLLITQVGLPALRARLPWQTFTSQDARFSVLLPQTPTDSVQNITTDSGTVPMRSFTVEDLGAQYVVAYAEYPEPLVKSQTPEKLLSSARDGSISALQNVVMKDSRAITLNGAYPGWEYRVDMNDQGATMLARIYLVQNRLYETVAIVPSQTSIPADAVRFLDSFKLLQ
jgi:hypothetical protein